MDVSEDMAFRDQSMGSILLIEDDKDTANEIKAELGDLGYVVDWAADGIEGLDKARHHRSVAIRGDSHAGIGAKRARRGG
jgi:CheY-like chemotaxis protein